MARKLYEKQAVRRRNGQLANGVALVVYTDEAGTVLADISTSVGGSAIAGSVVTTADIAGLGPASLRFWGPGDGLDTLYMRVPSDASLGVQKIEADPDPRLDVLEAAGGGDVGVHSADTTAIHGIADTAALALKPAASDAVFYASPNGSDANDGRSWGSAKLTIAAAVAALPAGGGRVEFTGGHYLNSAVTITSRYVELVGVLGATIALVGAGAYIHVNPAAGSMVDRIELRNFRIIGDSTFGQVGILMDANSSCVHLRAITILNCWNGLELKGTQFSSFHDVTIQGCTIGVRLYQDAVVGGGNDNTFEDVNIQSCQVGFMAYQTTVYPMGGNNFNNTAFHTNTLCAVYLENHQGALFSGTAHEANGEGTDATLTLFGRTLKRSTWHFVGSWARAESWFGVTTEADSIILEDHATLTIDSGSSSIFTPSVDATSRLLFGDHATLNGTIHGVAQWPSMNSESGAQILGEPLLTPSLMPNSVPNPRTLGLYGTTGGSSAGFDDDTTWGHIPYVQFAASAGSASTNKAQFDTKAATDYADAIGTFIACSLLIRSSVATTVAFDAWQSSGFGTHTLAAGKVYRLVIVGLMTTTPRSRAVTVYPTDSAGAKLNLWNAHAFVASDPGILSAFVHYGWFNDLSLVQGREAGGLEWGAAADTNLYRATANALKTDDLFSTANDCIIRQAAGQQVAIGNYGPGSTAGILFSSSVDATLYRSAATTLATDAHFAVTTAGKGLQVKEGTNAKMGVSTLVGGTVTVATTAVTASSRIQLTSQADGGTPGFLRVSARTAATSFVITSSSGADTSTVAWLILEPA